MSKLEHYLITAIGAILVIVTSLAIALFGGAVVASLIDRQQSPGAPGSNVYGGELGTAYYFSFAAIALVAGSIFVVIAWNRGARQWKRVALYAVSLIVLLGLSGANFMHNDSLVPRSVQALINLALAFVASVTVVSLSKLRFEATEATVFRVLAIALLTALAIALPLLFSALWLVQRLGVNFKLPADLLALVASAVGLTAAIVDLRLKSRQLNAKRADA